MPRGDAVRHNGHIADVIGQSGGPMQLKTADDRAPDVDTLQALLERPDIDARTRRLIEDEIWSIRLGAKAESDAAYQLDFDLKDGGHWAVIHDLRLDISQELAEPALGINPAEHLFTSTPLHPRPAPSAISGTSAACRDRVPGR